MRHLGWPYPVIPAPWRDLAAIYADLGPGFDHMLEIVVSVLAAPGPQNELAAFTSMHDLMVVAMPLRGPPFDLVAVRTSAAGRVVIEHLSPTGRNDKVEGSSSEAVPLFWRFMAEKFGVSTPAIEERHG